MSVNGTRAFDLLKKIGFTRVGGSEEEYKAARILKEECDSIGVPAEIEPFEIEDAEIETAELEILEPFRQSYVVTGYKCAQNTPENGLEAEFLYVEDATEVNLANARGKIVLVDGFMRVPLFKKLMKAGVAGIVTMDGALRDQVEETDLAIRKLRKPLRAFGNVPMVHLRVRDAFDLVSRGASKARMVLKNTVVKKTSHNVVATVKGTELPDEIISFGAHYDSVDFSTGVYDNGAGSVINMEILRWFKENPPRRTVKFMWYGSEEQGLEGSWAYVKSHSEELEKHVLMINVDIGGPVLGGDKAIVTAEEQLSVYLHYFANINGYSVAVTQGIYSSDSIPFADNGIPGVNFYRGGAEGAAYIHCRHDTLDFLSADMLEKTAVHVLDFGRAMANAVVFPIERKIPENIQKEVDDYLYKKELAEVEQG